MGILLTCLQATSGAEKVVCYYGSWAVYRPGQGKFDVENIDPTLCTHAIYGFAGLDATTNHIYAMDPYNDLEENWGKGAYKRFNALRSKNPELKTLIAIGGWNEGSEKYSKMAASESSRKDFVASCVDFIQKYGFNGLDVDWEYPANRGGTPEDKQNYILLLKELRQQFDNSGLLLSAAVSAGKATIDTAYNVSEIFQHVDFVNLMAYDYYGPWDTITGHNAPLKAYLNDTGDNVFMNVEYSVNYWLSLGAPKEKLVLGMGSYGRSFTLSDHTQNGIRQPTSGPGTAGPYTREAGSLGYNEICENMKTTPWTIVWDDIYQAPYAYNGDQWVGYDNPESIEIKCNFAKSIGLAGVMVWSVETDDFQGTCGTKFPLLNTMNKVIRGKQIS